MRSVLSLLILTIFLVAACASDNPAPTAAEGNDNMYARWQHGPPTGSDYFPVAVWLQDPVNATRYREAGINLYVGLWEGPTEEQLAGLRAAGMQVICDQNEVGRQHLDDPTIVGWMHGDEPDNAQSDGKGGYGPPILPDTVIANYTRLKAADPSRPILLNLGQGVAWDGWIGRGVRANHPEDYPEYVRGADIVSFDIYPVASDRAEVSGNLWYVANGVERLRHWAAAEQPVWNCIECSRIYNANKATPAQVKAEVWMALIHGSNGLVYFVHEWYPKFNEHALLDDPEMLAAVTAVNRQIQELAPVLNSATVQEGITVTSSDPAAPVAAMVKRVEGSTYLFAVGMRGTAVTATFAVNGLPVQAQAEVLGEGRTVKVAQGQWTDAFEPWGVHLYRIR